MSEGKVMWICGKWLGIVPYLKQSHWQIEGVFSSEVKAIEACKIDCHFIAPIELDKNLTEGTISWPGLYYPNANS